MDITGKGPTYVGQLASFGFGIASEEFPDATAESVTVTVCKPDGTEEDDTAGVTMTEANAFQYIATERIDMPGTWSWRVLVDGSLAGAIELTSEVAYSPFTVEDGS